MPTLPTVANIPLMQYLTGSSRAPAARPLLTVCLEIRLIAYRDGHFLCSSRYGVSADPAPNLWIAGQYAIAQEIPAGQYAIVREPSVFLSRKFPLFRP